MKAGVGYYVFSIRAPRGVERESVWVKAGTAFVNHDGSMNVYLDVLPLDGKLHILENATLGKGDTTPRTDVQPDGNENGR